MVKVLSGYLQTHILPGLTENYFIGKSEMSLSWIHLLDLIIIFEKQMQALVTMGNPLLCLDRSCASVLSVFSERSDWLHIWAEVELKFAVEKLTSQLYNEQAWMIHAKHGADIGHESNIFESSTEDYEIPPVVRSTLMTARILVDRSQMLTYPLVRAKFIRSSACKFLRYFFEVLRWKSQDAEVSSYWVDGTLLRAAGFINAASYCVCTLQEWGEDVDFLELRTAEGGLEADVCFQDPNTSFFSQEISYLLEVAVTWIEELIAGLLKEFYHLCSSYIQNRGSWGSDDSKCYLSEVDSVSSMFVEALDILRDRLVFLKVNLNGRDFLDLWRSIAGGLDHFVFGSIFMSNTEIYGSGIRQIQVDMRAMFSVFEPFCARPEAFFPCVNSSLKLFSMDGQNLLCI